MNSSRPVKIFYLFLFLLSGFLLYNLIDLQVVQREKYQRFAEENAAHINPISAPRGIIYDRSGLVMVKNRPVFSVIYSPEGITRGVQTETLRLLSKILETSDLQEIIGRSKNPSYVGIEIASNIPVSQAAEIRESSDRLPGVSLSVNPMREYVYKSAGIHALGYIGEISESELKELKGAGFRMGDYLGKDGIEKYYDQYLRGVAGGEKMEIDAYGKPVQLKESLDPEPGANVRLTIDALLQESVDKILGNYKGAVVVLDPRTGEILAMVSHPAYDPDADWEEISQADHPFMNRALSAYSSGSIFKPVVLQAAIDQKVFREKEGVVCRGYYQLGSRIANCWRAAGHGSISFIEALVWSCDVAFYELGSRLGPDRIAAYSSSFGFGKKTGIDLPGEKKGLVPDQAWKQKVYKSAWFPGDTINYAIGQGYLLVTPLQMASFYGQIAVGKRYKPYIVKEIKKMDGEVIFKQEPVEISNRPFSKEIRDALREVVRRGTGIAAKVDGIPAAGKTGTAENPGKAHAWFVAYAPYDIPEIVVSAFVEHGEHGDQAPARITRDILSWYKQYRLKREIPAEETGFRYIDHGGRQERIYSASEITPAASPEAE